MITMDDNLIDYKLLNAEIFFALKTGVSFLLSNVIRFEKRTQFTQCIFIFKRRLPID